MRQGSERARSWLRDKEMSQLSRPRMIACVSNRWMRLSDAKWIDQRSKWPMRPFKIVNSRHSRDRNKQLLRPRCRRRRIGRWTRSSEPMKSSVPVTWSLWSRSRSNKRLRNASFSSWSVRTKLISRSKKSWPVRRMSSLPTSKMLLVWSKKS